MLRSHFVVGMMSVVLIMPCEGVVFGQTYPNKTIRIVCGGVGGGTDFTARLVAQGISGPLGQPVIVDNRANGNIAAEVVSKAQPDGYSLFVGGAALWITPLLQKVPYDVARDFSPISLIERTIFIVAVHPSVPAKSVKELIALANAKPGALNYAQATRGGPSHLGTELFKSMAGVNIVNVPYKGNAAAITGLLGDEVQLMITDAGLLAPHVKSGKLRALAVTSIEPSALAPGLPTLASSGLPGFELVGATAMLAPGKTPQAVIYRLSQEIVRFLNRADVKEQFLNAGVEVVASSPEQFAATIKSDTAKWTKVIKDAGIKAE